MQGDILYQCIAARGVKKFPALTRHEAICADRYVDETAQDKILYKGTFGTLVPGGLRKNLFQIAPRNVANTGILSTAGKCLTFFEAGQPHSIDPVTLDTKGVDLLGGQICAGAPFSSGWRLVDIFMGRRYPSSKHRGLMWRQMSTRALPELRHPLCRSCKLLWRVFSHEQRSWIEDHAQRWPNSFSRLLSLQKAQPAVWNLVSKHWLWERHTLPCKSSMVKIKKSSHNSAGYVLMLLSIADNLPGSRRVGGEAVCAHPVTDPRSGNPALFTFCLQLGLVACSFEVFGCKLTLWLPGLVTQLNLREFNKVQCFDISSQRGSPLRMLEVLAIESLLCLPHSMDLYCLQVCIAWPTLIPCNSRPPSRAQYQAQMWNWPLQVTWHSQSRTWSAGHGAAVSGAHHVAGLLLPARPGHHGLTLRHLPEPCPPAHVPAAPGHAVCRPLHTVDRPAAQDPPCQAASHCKSHSENSPLYWAGRVWQRTGLCAVDSHFRQLFWRQPYWDESGHCISIKRCMGGINWTWW